MSLIQKIHQRLKRDYFRWRYARAARRVLDTAPLAPGQLDFILLSMVQKRDVVSYLVALKSFVHFACPKRIVVVCDPSIDAEDRAVLTAHVPHIELRRADEFTDPRIPRGGTWERLYAIAHYAAEDYVVQLDADTVTTQPVAEVVAAIQARTGFVLVEKKSTLMTTVQEIRDLTVPRLRPNPHVQSIAEATMATVGLTGGDNYVRGCSGFTGFPPNPGMRAAMLDYSERMFKALGDDWKRWGTEQVTSNYLVANSHGVTLLPFPKYCAPNHATPDTSFYHFIGSMRFVNNMYQATSAAMIKQISVGRG